MERRRVDHEIPSPLQMEHVNRTSRRVQIFFMHCSAHVSRAAHEAAVHTARLRVELSQSRAEQQDYLRQVELARILDKRAERKRKAGDDGEDQPAKIRAIPQSQQEGKRERPGKERKKKDNTTDIISVFENVF
jgi:ESF2/ABP1 family protein